MRVRMLGGRYVGDVREVPTHVGKNLIETGRAVPEHAEAKAETEPETAMVVPAPEKAIRRRGRPRKIREELNTHG